MTISNKKSAKQTKFPTREIAVYIIFIAVALLIAVGLGGCKGPKELAAKTKVRTDVKEHEEVKVSDKSTARSDSSFVTTIEEIERKTTEFEARLITYDTEKPVIPETGRPPVASELIYSNKTNADKKLTESAKGASSRRQENDIEIDHKRKMRAIKDSAVAESQKQPVKKETYGAFWWVRLLPFIALALWAVYKFYLPDKLKKIFKSLKNKLLCQKKDL